MSDKICPYINATCLKGACVAWVKIPQLDANGQPTGDKITYCSVFGQ